jgi:hypothetical protein
MNSVFLRDGRYAAHVGEASPDVPATRLLVKSQNPKFRLLSRNWRHNTLNANELYKKRLYYLRVEVTKRQFLEKSLLRNRLFVLVLVLLLVLETVA